MCLYSSSSGPTDPPWRRGRRPPVSHSLALSRLHRFANDPSHYSHVLDSSPARLAPSSATLLFRSVHVFRGASRHSWSWRFADVPLRRSLEYQTFYERVRQVFVLRRPASLTLRRSGQSASKIARLGDHAKVRPRPTSAADAYPSLQIALFPTTYEIGNRRKRLGAGWVLSRFVSFLSSSRSLLTLVLPSVARLAPSLALPVPPSLPPSLPRSLLRYLPRPPFLPASCRTSLHLSPSRKYLFNIVNRSSIVRRDERSREGGKRWIWNLRSWTRSTAALLLRLEPTSSVRRTPAASATRTVAPCAFRETLLLAHALRSVPTSSAGRHFKDWICTVALGGHERASVRR